MVIPLLCTMMGDGSTLARRIVFRVEVTPRSCKLLFTRRRGPFRDGLLGSQVCHGFSVFAWGVVGSNFLTIWAVCKFTKEFAVCGVEVLSFTALKNCSISASINLKS